MRTIVVGVSYVVGNEWAGKILDLAKSADVDRKPELCQQLKLLAARVEEGKIPA